MIFGFRKNHSGLIGKWIGEVKTGGRETSQEAVEVGMAPTRAAVQGMERHRQIFRR